MCQDFWHGSGHCPSCSIAIDTKLKTRPSDRTVCKPVAEQGNRRCRQFTQSLQFMTFVDMMVLLGAFSAMLNDDVKCSMVEKDKKD